MADWIAIGITLLVVTAQAIKSFGYDKRRFEDLEADQQKCFKYHEEHFSHTRDSNAHWTSREREELARKLEAIHSDVKDITRRRYGDTN